MKTSLQLPLSIVFIFLHVVTRRTVSSLDPGDEGKPYRFGFTIDGEQHRHESRDINGIVKGEFGFITGDGVYHVTAYATDENGNFRIVSTKNIKISEPLDQLDANAKTSGIQLPKITQREDVEVVEQPLPNQRPHEALVQSAPPADEPFDYVERKQMYSDDDDVDNSPVTTPSSSPSAYPFTLASTRAVGCSGCGIPAPTDKPQKMMFQTREFQSPPHDDKTQKGRDFSKENAQLTAANDGNNFPNNGNNFGNDGDNFPNNGNNFANNGNNFANNGNNFRNKGIGNVQSKTNYEGANGFDGNQPSIDAKLRNSNVPGTYRNSPSPNDGASVEIIGEVGDTRSSPLFDLRNGNSPRPGLSSVIVDETNGRIIVPNNKPIPIEDKYPNMAKGLPPGIEDKDILDLLYRFNYTFNFHGHYETGYKDGTKIGGYFVNGRDGISRVVTYVADEFGYRPKFKLVNLGLESPDTPKEETERKEFKLKSFEFVWFPIR